MKPDNTLNENVKELLFDKEGKSYTCTNNDLSLVNNTICESIKKRKSNRGEKRNYNNEKNDKNSLNNVIAENAYKIIKNGRLYKPTEPVNIFRSHNKFMLKEMMWMSIDYYEEKRWKKNVSKKFGYLMSNHFEEKKKNDKYFISSQISNDIKMFWFFMLNEIRPDLVPVDLDHKIKNKNHLKNDFLNSFRKNLQIEEYNLEMDDNNQYSFNQHDGINEESSVQNKSEKNSFSINTSIDDNWGLMNKMSHQNGKNNNHNDYNNKCEDNKNNDYNNNKCDDNKNNDYNNKCEDNKNNDYNNNKCDDNNNDDYNNKCDDNNHNDYNNKCDVNKLNNISIEHTNCINSNKYNLLNISTHKEINMIDNNTNDISTVCCENNNNNNNNNERNNHINKKIISLIEINEHINFSRPDNHLPNDVDNALLEDEQNNSNNNNYNNYNNDIFVNYMNAYNNGELFCNNTQRDNIKFPQYGTFKKIKNEFEDFRELKKKKKTDMLKNNKDGLLSNVDNINLDIIRKGNTEFKENKIVLNNENNVCYPNAKRNSIMDKDIYENEKDINNCENNILRGKQENIKNYEENKNDRNVL
ncbi:hypothetical protein PFLG_00316 [Plasmodium falciparum RAJ116]|uniref:HSA domain-containing protein n=1 Tax=Plasmodium falciparum RAJ116 TaxID=580058 RepID=A0A0L0CSJ3_PLAFA|nr:hypothetical protein PFLG_00316 [Plasmodium falciparum RAJ116]